MTKSDVCLYMLFKHHISLSKQKYKEPSIFCKATKPRNDKMPRKLRKKLGKRKEKKIPEVNLEPSKIQLRPRSWSVECCNNTVWLLSSSTASLFLLHLHKKGELGFQPQQTQDWFNYRCWCYHCNTNLIYHFSKMIIIHINKIWAFLNYFFRAGISTQLYPR